MSGDQLPSGTVTFLFTDIERSTETLAAMGNESYARALDDHRRLLRQAFRTHRGHEVGAEGDALFVAFARASDAVNAAIAGQRALDDQLLRVRIGIHTGDALVRENEYVGHDVHKAKRISDAGHGGQILLSSTTAELVRDSFALTHVGSHRLKDLGAPQHLHQVAADGLPTKFPPLRSLESFTHNLPTQRTSFIGREREIGEVRALLGGHRLVTLTGVGGCGKTRLALQVAAESLDGYPDGVFFVDLAVVSEDADVVATVARAVGVPSGSDAGVATARLEPTDELTLAFLSPRHCLIVLDNCEHLLEGCAEVAERILDECPHVVLLATGREALDIEGEQTWQIPSLSLPRKEEDTHASEAVSLFKARAKAVRSDFEITPSNVGAVTEICRRLDGIPLAIEFAAARVAHLPPQEIAQRLNDMFDLLVGGRRRVQRQQTLQAALDWSYKLLSEPERVMLRRCAVFGGSFTIEAAEATCSNGHIERRAVLGLLGSLVDKSLVTTEDREESARYRLIETVRLYASEKLRDADEADTLRTRHRDWYQAWVESFSWEQIYLSNTASLTIAGDWPNVRAALEWSRAQGSLDLAVRMAARVDVVANPWRRQIYEWLSDATLEELDLTADERVAALNIVALGSFDATSVLDTRAFDRVVEAAQGTPCLSLIQALCERAWNSRAIRAEWTRDPELAASARADIARARQVAEELGVLDTWRSRILMWEGIVELTLGNLEYAAKVFAEGLEADPDPHPGFWIDYLCAVHVVGDHARARDAAERFLEGSRRWEQRAVFFPTWVVWPALAIAGAGRLGEARALLRQRFGELTHSGIPGDIEQLGVGVAALAFIAGDAESTSRLLAWVRSRTIDRGLTPYSLMAYVIYRHYLRCAREALGSERARRCVAEGRAMSEDEAVQRALELLQDEGSEDGQARRRLTKRELEVAELLAEGLTNRRIAERLVISERTADAHVEHIRNKLGVRTRAQIASWVTEEKLRSSS